MAYNPVTNPVMLGVLAPTAGTPVRLTSGLVGALVDPNLPYGNANSGDDLWAQKIELQAPPGNGGNVYIGIAGMNKTTLAGVIKILEPGQQWPIFHYSGLNKYHVGEWFIDADITGSQLIGFADVA